MTLTDNPSPTTRLLRTIGALMPPSGSDPIVASLRERGLPVTVENYLSVAYPEGPPRPLPVELKQEAQRAVRAAALKR